MSQIFLETRMFRLSDSEEIMTLAFFVLIQYRSVTDRQTDGQTDGHLCSGYTSACVACYANALVKTDKSQKVRDKTHRPKVINLISRCASIISMDWIYPQRGLSLISTANLGQQHRRRRRGTGEKGAKGETRGRTWGMSPLKFGKNIFRAIIM